MGTTFSCLADPPTDDVRDTRTTGIAPSNNGRTPWMTDPTDPLNMKDLVDVLATPDDLDVPKSDLPRTGFSFADDSWTLHTFTLNELKSATRNFRDDRIRGEGGFGIVYKGFFYNSHEKKIVEVAIKKLRPESSQGEKEWLAEIQILGPLRHEQLVRLIGYCDEDGGGYLIYEYMARGSLDNYLFNYEGKTFPCLSWDIRLRVALHAAKGLAYLHEKKVIHRDFKSPNILIDKEFKAKLTDFGLAKGTDNDQTHVTTRIMGTMGYLDPIYMETGRLTFKSDVFAFGILLLELLTGRRAQEENEPPLRQWTNQYLQIRKPDVKSFMDPELLPLLSDKNVLKGAQTLAIAARRCIEEESAYRPEMAEMVDLIEPFVIDRV